MATEGVPEETVGDKLGGLSLDDPVADTSEESVVEEIKEGTPEGDAVKAEVTEAVEEELKAEGDIVPPETTTTEPVTSETAVEDVTPTKPTIGEKVSAELHKIVG